MEFEAAAEAQSAAIGFVPAMLYVPHPIQNRTHGELLDIADAAVPEILAALTAAGAVT